MNRDIPTDFNRGRSKDIIRAHRSKTRRSGMKSRWRFSIFVSVLLIGVPVHAERRDVATSDQFAMSDGRIAARPGGTSVLSKGKIRSLSTSSFQGFVHCPAELHEQCTDPFGSIPMDANTAYFRDVIIGAWTSISNATNGETWGATFTDPKTTAHVFPTVTFYSSYAGQQDCFVFGGGAYLCGSTSVDVLWYLQSQCLPPGTWKAEFSNTSIPPQFF